jgi:TatD DNase family protein
MKKRVGEWGSERVRNSPILPFSPSGRKGRLIDTHAHLCFPQFDADRDEVVARAVESGVVRILDVGTDTETSQKALWLAERYDAVWATVGFHPHDVRRMTPEGIETLRGMATSRKVIAIGETGLDFYRDYAPRDLQILAFRAHVRLARDLGLPLIVHDRDAHSDVMAILHEEGASEVGGVLHCFTGDHGMAEQAAAIGFAVSFGGSLTYKRSETLPVALAVPISWILLETDAPYLTPVPHRGKRNEPMFVRYVAERLAEAKGLSFDRVAEITTRNAIRMFRWDEMDDSPTYPLKGCNPSDG